MKSCFGLSTLGVLSHLSLVAHTSMAYWVQMRYSPTIALAVVSLLSSVEWYFRMLRQSLINVTSSCTLPR